MGSRHTNSRDSYEKCKADGKFVRLIHRIAKYYDDRRDQTFTDRAVKDLMYGEDLIPHNDMNMVRPKITNLIKDGLLKQVGNSFDPVTKRHVRLVQWDRKQTQKELFYA